MVSDAMIVGIWCGLVVLFAWFGDGIGPKRVFKALGYATVTVVVPMALFLGGMAGYASYKDKQREAEYAAAQVREKLWSERRDKRHMATELFAEMACARLSTVRPSQNGISPKKHCEYDIMEHAHKKCEGGWAYENKNTPSQHLECIENYLVNESPKRWKMEGNTPVYRGIQK